MTQVKHDNCDGCVAERQDIKDCDFYNDNINGDCPCTLCVVKPMCHCSLDECDPFTIYSEPLCEEDDKS